MLCLLILYTQCVFIYFSILFYCISPLIIISGILRREFEDVVIYELPSCGYIACMIMNIKEKCGHDVLSCVCIPRSHFV